MSPVSKSIVTPSYLLAFGSWRARCAWLTLVTLRNETIQVQVHTKPALFCFCSAINHYKDQTSMHCPSLVRFFLQDRRLQCIQVPITKVSGPFYRYLRIWNEIQEATDWWELDGIMTGSQWLGDGQNPLKYPDWLPWWSQSTSRVQKGSASTASPNHSSLGPFACSDILKQ